MSEYLFVYGTLRADCESPMSHILNRYCALMGTASMQGELYDLGSYPGMITTTDKARRVVGQCFELLDPPQALSEFDDYEECSPSFPEPRLYERQLKTCQMENGPTLQAWVYIYNRSLAGKRFIESGDYLQYLKENGVRVDNLPL